MPKNDEALVSWQDVPLALSLLTRLPVRVVDHARIARSCWAYPLVGFVVAGLASVCAGMAAWFGQPAPITALLFLTILIIVTGAMHEDGLADVADGFWGGWTQAQRLEIMKDSRLGGYGAIALFIGLAMRWAAIWLLLDHGVSGAVAALLTAAILSRATMPVLMAALPHARNHGLSHSVGRVSPASAALAMVIAFFLSLFLVGGETWSALFLVMIVTAIVGMIAHHKIGGQTGDVLGANQQLTEITVLLCLLA